MFQLSTYGRGREIFLAGEVVDCCRSPGVVAGCFSVDCFAETFKY